MKKRLVPLILLSVFIQLQVGAQNKNLLPRSTPEAEGVSSAAIIAFLDSIAASKHELHSFMLLRHGQVVAEGWWNPYRPDLKHTLYSLSKSFTATAVGFARSEGKLSLKDKVISFFPNDVPERISPNLQQLEVKDLLTMSVGQEPDPTGSVVQDSNWVRRFLALPIKYQPGTKFLYNSMATYMLSAIVQKVTGQKLIDYLQPRLFQPLSILHPDWEEDPRKINTGGWGLRLKTEDIAKFAQLFLQKGVWNGKQVLPLGWAEEASTAHIIQHPEYTKAQREFSDWEQGYGYQMWRCRNNAYRGDGAFGQYAIVLPELDAVIAITSETADMQGELNLIWKILLPAFQKGKLPVNQPANATLNKKLAALALPAKKDEIPALLAKSASFVMESNVQGIRSLDFRFKGDDCQVTFRKDTAVYTISFGKTDWQKGETRLRGPYLVSGAKNNLTGLPPFQVAGEYNWLSTNKLELVLRYIESPHTQTFWCQFDGDDLTVEIKQSFQANNPQATSTLKGKRNGAKE